VFSIAENLLQQLRCQGGDMVSFVISERYMHYRKPQIDTKDRKIRKITKKAQIPETFT
jgi:hypothetical protein